MEAIMAMHLSTRRWQDQVILLIGLWLLVSPWTLGYSSSSSAGINAHLAGAVMAILAAFDLYKTYVWAVVLNLAVGAWVAVSPWFLGAAGIRDVRINALVVGVAAIVLALWELRSDPELHDQWAGNAS
jgi:hypothetical protein